MLVITEGAIKNEKYRETGNIGYIRQRTKTNKTKNTPQKTKKMSNKDRPKTVDEPIQLKRGHKGRILIVSVIYYCVVGPY